MSKAIGRTHRFLTHGKYEKKGDAYSGLSTMSPDKQKVMAEIRVRAAQVEKRIKREGIE